MTVALPYRMSFATRDEFVCRNCPRGDQQIRGHKEAVEHAQANPGHYVVGRGERITIYWTDEPAIVVTVQAAGEPVVLPDEVPEADGAAAARAYLGAMPALPIETEESQ